MPRGKKFGGRDFQPGHKKVGGRVAMSPELKAAKKFCKESFQQAVNKLTGMTLEELKAYVLETPGVTDPSKPKATMLERMVAGQIQAAARGKTTPFSFLMDRMVGPVKQQVQMQVDTTLSQDLEAMSDEEKRRRLEELQARLTKP